MIYEWKTPSGKQNFGDSLYEIIYSQEFLTWCRKSASHIYFLMGSVVCDDVLDYASYLGKIPVFVHCGINGTDNLSPEKLKEAIFVGARGNITKKVLENFGVEVLSTLDPVYALNVEQKKSYFINPRRIAPHITKLKESKQRSMMLNRNYLSPEIETPEDRIRIIASVTRSKFLLSGSMHLAMIAHLADVPFAIYKEKNDSFVDHPIKWLDWLSSFGLNSLDVDFFDEFEQGANWYTKYEKLLSRSSRSISQLNIEELEKSVMRMVLERI